MAQLSFTGVSPYICFNVHLLYCTSVQVLYCTSVQVLHYTQILIPLLQIRHSRHSWSQCVSSDGMKDLAPAFNVTHYPPVLKLVHLFFFPVLVFLFYITLLFETGPSLLEQPETQSPQFSPARNFFLHNLDSGE